MFCIIKRFPLLLFVFVFPFSIFSQNDDSLQSNSFIDLKEKLKQTLVLADHLEHSNNYIEAYMKYTEVGKMASAAGKLDYAIDIYIVAITLREKHNLKIPDSYSDRNLAFLNLCNHLRQNINDKSVFWH